LRAFPKAFRVQRALALLTFHDAQEVIAFKLSEFAGE